MSIRPAPLFEDDDEPVPAYLSPAQIAAASAGRLSWKSTMTELRHAGLLERRGGRWRISRSALRERLSDLYDDVYRHFERERTTRLHVGETSRDRPGTPVTARARRW